MKFFKFGIILEVLSQEIPAKMQKNASSQLFLNFLKSAKNFLIFPSPKKFQKMNYFEDKEIEEFFEQIKIESDLALANILENFDVKTYFSSSRIAFKAELFIFQKTEEKIIKGPPKSSNELAIQKFLERLSASKEELQIIHEKGVEYYALIKKIFLNYENEQVLENLSSSCLRALKEFKWTNSLVYEGSNGDSWIRPIKNILAICEGPDKIVKKLNFEYAGISSSNFSFGHKFLSVKNFHEFEPQKIEISRIADYTSLLKQNFVLISPEERMNFLINSSKEKALEFENYLLTEKNDFKQSALHIKELFDELICIADWPNVLICEIQDQFMSLPKELIEYVMISHQRYCPLSLENGELSRKFIIIIDHKSESAEMKAGYEKVLFARLLDAKFFFERFLKADAEEIMNEKLKKKESEFSNLSIFDLNSKIFEISAKLLKSNTKIDLNKKILDASRIDLCFELISEYPALRGLMSSYFWKNQSNEKINEIFECEESGGDILEKIKSIGKNLYFNGGEVYKRENLDSEALEARLFGISEKIIRLQYFFFEKNQSPTGSKDPFALKRDANNLFEMILKDSLNDEFKKELFDFDLYDLILSHEKKNSENSLLILNFLYKNLEQYLLSFFIQCDLDFSKKIIGFLINELSCWAGHSWVKDLFENQRLNPLKIMQISSYFIDLKSKINSDFKESFKRLSGIYLKKYALFKIDLNDRFEFDLKEELGIKEFCNEIENKTKEISCSKIYIEKILECSSQISESINSFLDNVFIEDEDQKKKMRRIFLIKKLFEIIESKFPFHKFFEFF